MTSQNLSQNPSQHTTRNPLPSTLHSILRAMAFNTAVRAIPTEPTNTDVVATEGGEEFDIEKLVIIAKNEPDPLPDFLYTTTIPDTEGYYLRSAALIFTNYDFETTEERLKEITANAIVLLARVFLSLVEMGQDEASVSSRCEKRTRVDSSQTDAFCIAEVAMRGEKIVFGVVDLNGWQLAYKPLWHNFPRDMNTKTPTNAEPQDRIIRRVCMYAALPEWRHVAITGPPFIFTFAGLHPPNGPIYEKLILYGNLCAGWNKAEAQARLNSEEEWFLFYRALAQFVLYGLFTHIPEFQERLRIFLTNQGQENAWKTLKSSIGEHFSDSDPDVAISPDKVDGEHAVSRLTSLVSGFIGSVARKQVNYLLPFLSSFRPHPNFSALHIEALTYVPHLFHLDLHPDRVLVQFAAIVFIYEAQGLVVKTFTHPEQYRNEISAYSVFSGCPGFPSLLAHGRSPPFIVITYGGVSPSELSPAQLSFIHENILGPMHAAGWHHHDVAERNVVIDKVGTLRLIDFQLATQGCTYGGDCPDLEFIEINDLPPLPSTCASSDA